MAPAVERVLSHALRAYRVALKLYPHPFHHQYADALEADFIEASDEHYAARGWAGLWHAWTVAWCDLPGSLVREWLRTPWPLGLFVAGAVAILATLWRLRASVPLSRYRHLVAAGPVAPESPQLLLLMLLMVLVPTASIVLVTAVTRLTMRRHRGRERRV